MLNLQNQKLKLGKKKMSQTVLDVEKMKVTNKSAPKRQRSASTLPKNNGLINEKSSIHKSSKTKVKIENNFGSEKKEQKTQNTVPIKHSISNHSGKEYPVKYSKSLQKKEVKYIFNHFKNTESRNSLTIKPRNSTFISHSKSYSNQTVVKTSVKTRNDPSSFIKSSNAELTKMKKKKHEYIKAFNKTSCVQKNSSNGFASTGFELNSTLGNRYVCNTGLNISETENKYSQMKQKISDQQIQNIKIQNCTKLSQIRLNAQNLFKKLKSPHKEKLLIISDGYEKIVSELYKVINKNSLPNCQISRINTTSSIKEQKQNYFNSTSPIKLFESTNQNSHNSKEKIFSHDTTYHEDESEHWDSYLDYDQPQNRKTSLMKGKSQKQSLVKKLNLEVIKKNQIQQYQDEFMGMNEVFSESWKREINQQKRF